jgi:hypothetical protein
MSTINQYTNAWLIIILLAVSEISNAELHDRGGGLIYDDVLDITWLQDANFAKTNGDDPTGRMTWEQAMQWAQNLEYYDSVRNVTWTDWRLPRIGPINGGHYVNDFSIDGTTDRGFNTVSINSELAHMYYVSLGNLGYAGTDGSYPQSGYGLVNTGPFTNLRPLAYWSESEYEPFLGHAWGFILLTGSQHAGVKGLETFYAWAVRDGDVGAPVEPALEITSPVHATAQSGVITVSATVSGMQAQRVIFVAAGELICLDFTAPYSCDWDTTLLSNGVSRIYAIATDAEGGRVTDTVTVGIRN